MRVLVLGAGGTGGYFGGRLAEIGGDVSFLVRPARARLLAERGLVIKSAVGDATLRVKTVSAEKPGGPYDIVLLTCKAYDLDTAMDAIAGAVGPNTLVVPLLNGLLHLDTLTARFGAEHVAAGLCQIGVTLSPEGEIHHLDRLQTLVFGTLSGAPDPRLTALVEAFAGAKAELRQSDTIMLEMWEKFVMLTALAAVTTLFRSTTDHILAAPDGRNILLEGLEECRSTAEAAGFPPRPAFMERIGALFTDGSMPRKASMARDIDRGNRVEADHVVGDMLARARAAGLAAPVLRISYAALKAYEHARPAS